MAILSKIVRVILFPKELAMRAMVKKHNREVDAIEKKADEIMDSFKTEIANDPDIQEFLNKYDKETHGGKFKYL